MSSFAGSRYAVTYDHGARLRRLTQVCLGLTGKQGTMIDDGLEDPGLAHRFRWRREQEILQGGHTAERQPVTDSPGFESKERASRETDDATYETPILGGTR